MGRTEILEPVYDGRKSFYGKADVFTRGYEKTLYSYETEILTINTALGDITKIAWNGYTHTTMRHINDFLQQNGFNKLNKSEWEKLCKIYEER